MLATLIQELEHQYDRMALYNDVPDKAQYSCMLNHWIKLAKLVEVEMNTTSQSNYDEGYAEGIEEKCFDHQDRIKELEDALVHTNEVLRQIQELI